MIDETEAAFQAEGGFPGVVVVLLMLLMCAFVLLSMNLMPR